MNTEKRIRIEHDNDAESPRDWDNLGTMACWHGRYNLGDERPICSPEEFRSELPKDIIELPLFLYDHSGITMNTAGFHCPWDSGQVGFIYVSRTKVREEMGWKRITKAREKKIMEILRSEVEVYDQFLRGDVYGFVIEAIGANGWEVEDSCFGFYGDDPFENGMSEHIDEELHPLLKEAA